MDTRGYAMQDLIRENEALRKENEELQRQLSEARAADIAKETFLSNMSHDIRTPMNAIVGMTALAKNHIDEKSRVQDALGKIETASGHLLNLINDILDMSRINSGKMQIASDNFQLGDLIHETMTIITPQAAAKGHTVDLATEDIDEESLYGDAFRLRQVYVNIISNSVKYTENGGIISIRFSESSKEGLCLLKFECTDNGIGMSEEFLSRVFEPFERVSNSTISKIEGTGLGMSIVKKLVDAMNGSISIKSRQGEGTTVCVEVPLKAKNEEINTAFIKDKNILVIEADGPLAEKYRKIFSEYSVRCTVVSSVPEAISAVTDAGFAGGEFDAVIIGEDRQDSGDVFSIASYFRKSYPGMRIALVSTDKWEDIEYRAVRSGVDCFIPVPFFRSSLINGLDEVLRGSASDGADLGYPDLAGKRILLVEDNMINREIAKEILGVTGADIYTAENGKEAVDAFEASAVGWFALILMDIQMPVMDGYEAVRTIRAMSRDDASSVPIYAMTANTFAEDIAKARAAGMNGHIAKPIDMNTLMNTLRQI